MRSKKPFETTGRKLLTLRCAAVTARCGVASPALNSEAIARGNSPGISNLRLNPVPKPRNRILERGA